MVCLTLSWFICRRFRPFVEEAEGEDGVPVEEHEGPCRFSFSYEVRLPRSDLPAVLARLVKLVEQRREAVQRS
jgi:hypothetical protein